MCRFKELLAHIAKTDVRLVNLSMGSNDPDDWHCFAVAAKAMPHVMFVASAGNNGRNIDEQPVYPASMALENMVVVSSSDNFGMLGAGSNYGPQTVDILVPAEQVSILDHRGAKAKTGGTSYAAPRVTALLARYLAKKPNATPIQMIDLLRKRAIATSMPLSRFGWIPDPSDDFGF
jgi:subtilisin family serine protease